MNEIVLRAGPGTAVRFPAYCVYCLESAGATMRIKKSLGYASRQIEAPLCRVCGQELRRRSAAEEQLQKIRWLILGVALPLTFALTLLLTPASLPFLLRLLFAASVVSILGVCLWAYFQNRIYAAALPAKAAVRQSVQIRDFSPGMTALVFSNGEYSARFKAVNLDLLTGEA